MTGTYRGVYQSFIFLFQPTHKRLNKSQKKERRSGNTPIKMEVVSC